MQLLQKLFVFYVPFFLSSCGAPTNSVPNTSHSFNTKKTSNSETLKNIPHWGKEMTEIVRLINQERQSRDIGPIEISPALMTSAQEFVKLYTRNNQKGIRKPDISEAYSIAYRKGYKGIYKSSAILGGYKTPSEVVAALMADQSYAQMILNPEYNQIGIGYCHVPDSDVGYWWFLNLGIKIDTRHIKNYPKQVVELVNAERTSRGLGSLEASKTLTNCAQNYAINTAEKNWTSHTGPDGSTPSKRMKKASYKYFPRGECLACGQKNPELVVNSWMKSFGHREILLDPEANEVGVGYICLPNSEATHYWVLNTGIREKK